MFPPRGNAQVQPSGPSLPPGATLTAPAGVCIFCVTVSVPNSRPLGWVQEIGDPGLALTFPHSMPRVPPELFHGVVTVSPLETDRRDRRGNWGSGVPPRVEAGRTDAGRDWAAPHSWAHEASAEVSGWARLERWPPGDSQRASWRRWLGRPSSSNHAPLGSRPFQTTRLPTTPPSPIESG